LARRALSTTAGLLLPLALGLGTVMPAGLPADDPVAVRYAWSAPRDCRREASVGGLVLSVDPETRRERRRGTIRRVGRDPIRDVTVCFGAACTTVARGGVIAANERSSFAVDGIGRRDAGRPSVHCSVLEPRAGA
jgi:hypothetical protein